MNQTFVPNKAIQWLLCWYEESGYVYWEVHTSRESAMNEGPHTNEDWCVVRYNKSTGRHSISHYEGRTFPINILVPNHGENITIYSDPVDKLSHAMAHYEEKGPISDPTIDHYKLSKWN